MTRRQGYRSWLILVGHGDGHRYTVRRSERVGGSNRHGVAALGFIVQGVLGPQLAGCFDNGKGGFIGSAQGVGQDIAGVGGRDRDADVDSRRLVLGNAAGISIFGEAWYGVDHRRLLHLSVRYCLGSFFAIQRVVVGRRGPQVFPHVIGARDKGG